MEENKVGHVGEQGKCNDVVSYLTQVGAGTIGFTTLKGVTNRQELVVNDWWRVTGGD